MRHKYMLGDEFYYHSEKLKVYCIKIVNFRDVIYKLSDTNGFTHTYEEISIENELVKVEEE